MEGIAHFDPQTTIVVATGNAHKVTEIEEILAQVLPRFSFVALGQLGNFDDPEEDGSSFYENALIKARFALAKTACIYALADDSGLCVDALDGKPGIYSARFAGVHGDDARNNEKLLRELEQVSPENRRAHFHCSLALIKKEPHSNLEQIFRGEGNCFGYIAQAPKGNEGFGYDPLFLPDGAHGRTMAELSRAEKNSMSHRRRALDDLALKLS